MGEERRDDHAEKDTVEGEWKVGGSEQGPGPCPARLLQAGPPVASHCNPCRSSPLFEFKAVAGAVLGPDRLAVAYLGT